MNVNYQPVPHSAFRVPHSTSRRGVTLLFVISMIVLFLLMGTTFVVVSNDYLRASRRRNVSGGVNSGAVTREQGHQLVVQSFLDAVRGPSLDNTQNPLRGHDLLGDMYGYGIRVVIDGVPTRYRGTETPFIRFFVTDGVSLLSGAPEPLVDIPGHYAGQVLTIVDGDFEGLTARIIQHIPPSVSGVSGSQEHELIVHPLDGTHDLSGALDDMDQRRVIINGKAFAGTGAGQFDATVLRDMPALESKAETPNQVGQTLAQLLGGNTPTIDDEGYLTRWEVNSTGMPEEQPNPSSTNEPWDAVDFQNMMLAQFFDENGNGLLNDDDDEIIPSFGGVRGVAGQEHKDFQAFPSLALRHVDNNNDGIDDGIWIDTGMPVRSTPDGEYIKPLVSFLILDMGGRLNINAHGNASEVDAPVVAELLGTPTLPTLDLVPRGWGFGPAEISLSAVLAPQEADGNGVIDGNEIDIAQRILNARYSNASETENVPGVFDTIDGKARYAFTGYPDGLIGNHFGSPLDLYGRAGLGVLSNPDPAINNGSPLNSFMPDFASLTGTPDPPIDDQLVDSPYEVDLLLATRNSNDALFDVTDLERLLRPADRDSILLSTRLDGDDDDVANGANLENSRLAPLFSDMNDTTTDQRQREFFRNVLTTHSFEVPAIPLDINRRLFDALDPMMPNNVMKAVQMGLLLSPEVRRGLPMDINRIFGDGQDNDVNGVVDGVVDNIGEDEEPVRGVDPSENVVLDVDNDNMTDDADSGLLARNNFARRLFVLMILLTEYEDRNGNGVALFGDTNGDGTDEYDFGDFFDFTGEGAVDEEDIWAHRRMLAQWCVNVVDFRDPDSIMTPFEVDLDPFDDMGWEVDGNPFTTTDASGTVTDENVESLGSFPGLAAEFPNYVVLWGLERPELLITETVALHDRKTQDTETEGAPISQGMASETTPTNGDDPDEDFDSVFVPSASAFFELYNPWLSVDQNPTPAELADEQLDAPGSGVDLVRVAPDDTPVWRLLVVDPVGFTGTGTDDSKRFSADFESRIDSQLQMLGAAGAAGSAPAISRIVYFTNPVNADAGAGTQEFTGGRVYYPDGTGVANTTILEPGSYAVIGSAGVTYFGRMGSSGMNADPMVVPDAVELGMTQRIELDPGTDQVTVFTTASVSEPASVFGITTVANDGTGAPGNRPFGLSDPIEGYAAATGRQVMEIPNGDGFFFANAGVSEPLDMPVDQDLSDGTIDNMADSSWDMNPINRDGLTTGYRIVLLQRLANPLAEYDVAANPYRTIDSSAVDLFAFNGFEDDSLFTGAGVAAGGTAFRADAFGTFERGETTSAAAGERLLWRTSVRGETDAVVSGALPTAPTGHVLDRLFINSLGRVNDFYANPTSDTPFPWLTWNNRPFANQYELVNVPYTSPGWLTRLFGVAGLGNTDSPFVAREHSGVGSDMPTEGDLLADTAGGALSSEAMEQLERVIHPNATGFTHLFNFTAEDDGGTPASDRLHVMMDFLEVPSRFAGTRQYVNTEGVDGIKDDVAEGDLGYRLSAPFDELNTYRYPGKVNLNTVSTQRIWDALLGSRDPAMPSPYAADVIFENWITTLAGNPLRPASASNYVSSQPVPGTANAGLFRSESPGRGNGEDVGGGVRLDFIPMPQLDAFNTDRNAYFRNGLRQRLGGVATNRSSVFAIWVTVGYFQWDPVDNDFRMNGAAGIEFGEEDGTVQRSRGFFIFDRSIPMAYEPGEDHNVDRGILLQSLIE